MNYQKYIKENITREEITHRGGGVEISLDAFGIEGGLMSAYQNYLGGSMLGSIQGNMNGPYTHDDVQELQEELKKYFFKASGGEYEDYEGGDTVTFEDRQSRPGSAY